MNSTLNLSSFCRLLVYTIYAIVCVHHFPDNIVDPSQQTHQSFPKQSGKRNAHGQQRIYAIGAAPSYPSAQQIQHFLSKSKITETELGVEHVEMLLRVLELDGEIEKVIGTITFWCYCSRWCRYLHSPPLHGILRQNPMLTLVRAPETVIRSARAPRNASRVLQRVRARNPASGSGDGLRTPRTVILTKNGRTARRKNARRRTTIVTRILIDQS